MLVLRSVIFLISLTVYLLTIVSLFIEFFDNNLYSRRWGSQLPVCTRLTVSLVTHQQKQRFCRRKCLQRHLQAPPQTSEDWKDFLRVQTHSFVHCLLHLPIKFSQINDLRQWTHLYANCHIQHNRTKMVLKPMGYTNEFVLIQLLSQQRNIMSQWGQHKSQTPSV